MGADLITLGYTSTSPEPSIDEAKIALINYLEQARALLPGLDGNYHLEAQELDERGFDEDGEDQLFNLLLAGFQAHANNYRYLNQYLIPQPKGAASIWFNLAGGTSWGDDPFEGFSDLGLLLDVIDALPELGQRLGILGSGIVLPEYAQV